MAQAVQSAIVDLTSEDNDDSSIARAQAACEKAFAAASRLTNHFESLKSSRPIPYKSSNERVDPGEKIPLPADVPKPLMPLRLGASSEPPRFETNALKKAEKSNAIQRQDSSVPSPGVLLSRSALGTAAPMPVGSPSISVGAEGSKRQPGETKSVIPATDISTIRMPRSAAVSAKQNIAETCNELEEWVNKDPNLIPQQAGVNTPKKPGRPKKDADEWSPSSSTKSNVEERKGLGKIITYSPTPAAGKQGELTVNEADSLPTIKGISTSLGTKKRKLSGSSQSRDSPVKSTRWNGGSNAHHDSMPPSSAELTSSKHVHDGIFPKCVYPALKAAKAKYKQSLTEDELTGIGKSITDDIVTQGIEAFCPASADCPKNQRTELILKYVSEAFHKRAQRFRIKTNDELPSKLLIAKSRENGTSTNQADAGPFGPLKPSMLHTHEKIDPRMQQGFQEASGPTKSEPRISSAPTEPVAFTALFESVVYPAMKKSKKRHKDDLPREELDAIGKTIVNDVLKKLASHSGDTYQPDENTKKKIKHFVKKSFRQKVRKANVQSSQNSATAANGPRLDTYTLSSVSSGLEGTPGGHHPRTPGLNHSQNASSTQAITANGNEEVQAPQQPHSIPVDQPQSLSLQTSPNEFPSSSFGPDFDRGRYPALRRRRGSKYWTPARTSKTTPKHLQIHSKTSDNHSRPPPVTTDPTSTALNINQHSNNVGISNGKDQLRLLKAIANQSTISRASETQLTTLTTGAEKKRIPTNQKSALELLASIEQPTDMRPVSPESASYGAIFNAQQEAPTQAQERMAEVGEAPAGSRRSMFPHLARSRNNATTRQSAQQILRKRLLEDTGPSEEPRPSFRPNPATMLDPVLERVVAVLVTDTSSRPFVDGQRYSITPTHRKRLVTDQSIVTHVDLTPKVGKPRFVRVETKVIDPVRRPGRCISSLLRNRELALSSRGRHIGTLSELHQLKSEMIEPWKNWKGASGDVVAVAWSPDSNVYAFGAAAHTNVEDIQYNRPCNLLLGNLTSNQIKELPDHRVDRPKPETIPNGPNATQAVYDACDPKVYETVTSIAFSPTGDRMLTASHDCTVKIWDISAGKHQCLSTLRHEAWVTSVEISGHRPGLFATASKCVKDAVRIYHDPADPSCYVNFSASRAEARPDWRIYPECLRWGPSPHHNHLLLAGFQQWEEQGDLLSGGGQLCLWDANAMASIKVTPSSQSVYAAAWHPTLPYFATGGAPGNNLGDKINTKTVVRTWDFRMPKRYHFEYECPAIDMQDITFSPMNPNVVTAGCTDGVSYVWDQRWPDQPLHHLKHGRPLVDLDHTREREEADTGVMLSLWGPGGSLFYTGSSDGMIKAWDVRRHPEEVLISNVASFEVSIQSGAFSPDGNNLLVGDAEGGIHILSCAPCVPRSNVKSTDAYIDLVRASNGSGLKLDQNDDNPGTEGIEAAKSLVQSGQLEYHKELGIGQGPNYQGPYATYARKEAVESGVGRLRKKFEKKQPISKRGEKRWDIAIPMTSLLYDRKQTLNRVKDGDKTALDGPNKHEPKAIQRSRDGEALQTTSIFSTPEGALSVSHPSFTSVIHSLANESVGVSADEGDEGQRVEYNTIPESEMVEENYWWARMGEEEINQARAGRVRD